MRKLLKIILLVYTPIFFITLFSWDFFDRRNIDNLGRILIVAYPVYIVFYLIFLLIIKNNHIPNSNYSKGAVLSKEDKVDNKQDGIFWWSWFIINFIFSFLITPLLLLIKEGSGNSGLGSGIVAFIFIILLIFFIIFDLLSLLQIKKSNMAGAYTFLTLSLFLMVIGLIGSWEAMNRVSLFFPVFFLLTSGLFYFKNHNYRIRKYFMLLIIILGIFFIFFFPRVSKMASKNFNGGIPSYEQFYKCRCIGFEGGYNIDKSSSYRYYKNYCYGIPLSCVSKGARNYSGETILIPEP